MSVQIEKVQAATATQGNPSARVVAARALTATVGNPAAQILKMASVGAYPSSAANPVNAKIPALQAVAAIPLPWQAQSIYRVRNLVIGSKQQSAWGAIMQDADLDRRVIFDASSVSSLGFSFDSSRNKVGRGTAFPSVRWATDQTFEFPNLVIDVDSYMAGWIAAFAMGSDTASGAGPYTHACTFAADGELRPTTIYVEDSRALHHKFPDVCVDHVTISASGKGVVQATLGLKGTGRYSRIRTDFALPDPPARKMLMVRDSQVAIGSPGAPAAYDADRIVAWRVTIANSAARLSGPGDLAASKLTAAPSAQFSIALLCDAADDLLTLLKSQPQNEVHIAVNSGADCQWQFRFPLSYISAAQFSTFDGLVGITISSDNHSVMQPSADVPLEITTINSQPSYLGAA